VNVQLVPPRFHQQPEHFAQQQLRAEHHLYDGGSDVFRRPSTVGSKVWSAQGPLDTVNPTTRKVWMSTTATATYPSKLKPFKWADLSLTDASKACGDAANEPACFSSPYINSLSQFCSSGSGCLDATAKTNASGTNLVSFLRGDVSNSR
jgi:hypothetical protein